MRLEEERDHAGRLLGSEGADTIDEDSAFLDVARRRGEDAQRARRGARDLVGAQAPARVGVAAQGAQARARRVDQDAAEERAALQVEALRDVALERAQVREAEPARGLVDQRDARAVQLERDHLAARADLLGELDRLRAGRGAAVDHGVVRLGAEQERHELRGLVLDHVLAAVEALGAHGVERRAGDTVRRERASARPPSACATASRSPRAVTRTVRGGASAQASAKASASSAPSSATSRSASQRGSEPQVSRWPTGSAAKSGYASSPSSRLRASPRSTAFAKPVARSRPSLRASVDGLVDDRGVGDARHAQELVGAEPQQVAQRATRARRERAVERSGRARRRAGRAGAALP